MARPLTPEETYKQSQQLAEQAARRDAAIREFIIDTQKLIFAMKIAQESITEDLTPEGCRYAAKDAKEYAPYLAAAMGMIPPDYDHTKLGENK